MLSIRLLGEFDVEHDGKRIGLEPRIRRLLAYLVLNPRAHSRENLIAQMWPDSDADHLADLRANIYRLRKALGESSGHPRRILSTELLRFVTQPGDFVDLQAIEEVDVESAETGYLTRLARCYGPPADEIADFISLARQERLATRYGRIASALCARLRNDGDLRGAEYWAECWQVVAPADDNVYAERMRICAAQGDEDGVLRAFEAYESHANMPASSRLRQVHDQCISEARNYARMDQSAKHNLPTPATPLIGRQSELAQLSDLLTAPDAPIVTILGLGGTGKTRLAIEAARRTLRAFGDGVYLIALDDADRFSVALQRIADVIGYRFFGSDSAHRQLLRVLAPKRMLLILDGVERLVAGPDALAFADWVGEISTSGDALRVLVTTRQRLLAHRARVFDLRGLSVAEETADPESVSQSGDAERLFVTLASRRAESIALNPEAVSRICRLVDGMPLAIELAISWVRVLSLADIASVLERERDLLLAQDDGVEPARYVSIRSAFEMTWNQLAAEERSVFLALCQFERGCSYDAAKSVGQASGSALLALSDKALIFQTSNGRIAIHELLRDFGRDKALHESFLPQRREARVRLAGYFDDYVRRHQSQPDAFAHDWGNIQTALNIWHEERNSEHVLGMVDLLAELWYARSRYAEALNGHVLAEVAAMTLKNRAGALRSLRWQGRMWIEQGDYAQVEKLQQQALALAFDEEDEHEIGLVRYDQAWCAIEQGRGSEADRLIDEGARLLAEHPRDLAALLNLRVRRALDSDEVDRAILTATRAVQLLEPFGPSGHLAHAHKWLSDAYQSRKDWAHARKHAERAAHIGGVIGDAFTEASCRYMMALLHCRMGEQLEQGLKLSRQAHRAFMELGVRKSAAYALDVRGQLHWKLRDLAQARDCIEQSQGQLIELGDDWALVNIRMHLGDVLYDMGEIGVALDLWRQAHDSGVAQSHPYVKQLAERLAGAPSAPSAPDALLAC